MKDLFGNTKPVQIESGEWWFNGRIIQEQRHPNLMPFVSFNDGEGGCIVATHNTFKEAAKHCLMNPCATPYNLPCHYIGGA